MAQVKRRTTATGENRYDVRTRIGGRVVTRTFNRRKDADAYAATTEADKLRSVVVDPRRARVTVEDYANRWLKGRNDLAERTVELYRWLLDRHIIPTLGATSLADLAPSTVRTWHAGIAAKHPTTAAKCYRLLSSLMRRFTLPPPRTMLFRRVLPVPPFRMRMTAPAATWGDAMVLFTMMLFVLGPPASI
jgi:hypothetical protein